MKYYGDDKRSSNTISSAGAARRSARKRHYLSFGSVEGSLWKDGRSVESRDRKLAVNGPDEAIVGPGGIPTPTNPQACSICRTHAGEHTLRALWILGVLIIRGDHNMNVGIYTKPAFSLWPTWF